MFRTMSSLRPKQQFSSIMHETPVFSAAWTSCHSSSIDDAPPTSMAAYLPADIASAARARWEFQDVGTRTPSTDGSAMSPAAS